MRGRRFQLGSKLPNSKRLWVFDQALGKKHVNFRSCYDILEVSIVIGLPPVIIQLSNDGIFSIKPTIWDTHMTMEIPHYIPLYTIINHDQPLLTMINRHSSPFFPSGFCVKEAGPPVAVSDARSVRIFGWCCMRLSFGSRNLRKKRLDRWRMPMQCGACFFYKTWKKTTKWSLITEILKG